MGGGRLQEVVAHGGSTAFRLRQITLQSICRIVHIIKAESNTFWKYKIDTEKIRCWLTVCHILPTDWLFIQENRFWRRSVMTGVGRCGQYQGNKKSNGQIHEDILNQYIVSTMIESINQLFAILWCSGRVPSPNDVIQKTEKTRDNTRTKQPNANQQ